jgi:hypothetical protein
MEVRAPATDLAIRLTHKLIDYNKLPKGGHFAAWEDALIAECRTEEENWLNGFRAMLWDGGAAGSLLAASHMLKGSEEHKIILAAALAGVLMPALVKALRLDSAIRDYARAAARFKNIQASSAGSPASGQARNCPTSRWRRGSRLWR